eukprot:CAMPEP_0180280384 /NCGR_PEP_ID=MMETSP0988-20121125/8601_1 /TAXON_ID=697907 /ORGANISM="non described non described, Strain CCMP2293" /LENGTH=84 /DNA_ID=CAMNT_0022252221 /DNA_START=455 /DNA_END=707 /DNA_ORIENTATION=-
MSKVPLEAISAGSRSPPRMRRPGAAGVSVPACVRCSASDPGGGGAGGGRHQEAVAHQERPEASRVREARCAPGAVSRPDARRKS